MLSKVLDKMVPWLHRNAINKALNKVAIIKTLGKPTTQSVTVWRGNSLFDGKPIRVILSGHVLDSQNTKTGEMIQVYILPDERDSFREYKDKSPTVCGDCKYLGGGCYVSWNRTRQVQASSAKHVLTLEDGQALCSGLRVRVGAAGDPASVPFYVWDMLLRFADDWTGYTHAWKYCDARLKQFFVASCDSVEEVYLAKSRAWSVFYVKDAGDADIEGSITCLSQNSVQCVQCLKCKGGGTKTHIITETLHGASNTLSYARKQRSINNNKKGA